MSTTGIYHQMALAREQSRKLFAVLIDPDKMKMSGIDKVIRNGIESGIDFFFIGGSLIVSDMLDKCINAIKVACDIPVVLFPGNSYQLSYKADGILFLSLISGRNPELLIGNHVLAAPFLKLSALEILSTGYLLIDGGVATTVSYISNTQPIPAAKPDIAACTAMAGEMLGMKLIYLDAGSGALRPVSAETINAVANSIDVPIIVGGGIRSPEAAILAAEAGADIIVVGNAIESAPELIFEIASAVHRIGQPVAK